MWRKSTVFLVASLLGLCGIAACSSSTNAGSNARAGSGAGGKGGSAPSGGAAASGGSSVAGSGGTVGSGGVSGGSSSSSAGTGGASGKTSTGGRVTGGTLASGGVIASGDSGATGGISSGGSQGSGGTNVAGSGGSQGSGGSNVAGGISTSFGGSGGRPDGSPADAPNASDVNSSSPDPFVSGTPPAITAHFKKGINLGNRLEAPNEGDWGGKVLASDFPFIAKRGFDHVRIPIRFSGHASVSAPYAIDATFLARIDAVLDQATAANLAVLVDMHAYDEMATDPAGQLSRFVALWSQIASRYQNRPDTVAFELLNEPNTQLDTTWNDIAVAAITAIRMTNPHRLVVVDTVSWADPTKLAMLVLPNDANIMVAVHLYEPKLFSFQGMSWMGPAYMTMGVVFPGPPTTPIAPVAAATSAAWSKLWFDSYNTLPAVTNPSGPATVTAQLALVTSYKQAQGRTVYNGEWGPQDQGPMDSRARLVTTMRQQCDQAGVGWAIWEDPVNMNLFDSTAGTWVNQMIDALLP